MTNTKDGQTAHLKGGKCRTRVVLICGFHNTNPKCARCTYVPGVHTPPLPRQLVHPWTDRGYLLLCSSRGVLPVTQPAFSRQYSWNKFWVYFSHSKCQWGPRNSEPGPSRNQTKHVLVKGFWDVLEDPAHLLKKPK